MITADGSDPGEILHEGRCFALTAKPHTDDADDEPRRPVRMVNQRIITLWIEDDGFWHPLVAFSDYWLPDLLRGVSVAIERLPIKHT